MPYYPDVYIESADDEIDPDEDVLEVIDTRQPTSESFALEADEATVQYEIPFRKRRSFLRYALGFAYMDPARYIDESVVPSLKRENPIVHPYFPWMRAVSVTFQGFGPGGATAPEVSGRFANGLSDKGPIFDKRYAAYRQCIATVKFKTPAWRVLEDDHEWVGSYGEIVRNTFIDVAGSVESLSAEGGPIGQMKWSETATGGPVVGQAITNSFNTLVSKNNFLLNLVQFPAEFFTAGNRPDEPFVPSNVLKCVARVNSARFMGFEPGTLLMQPPKFQRFRWPILGMTEEIAFYGYNVQIPFQHHDPDKGVADEPPGTSPYRGFRLLPWAKNLLWYRATRGDGSTHLLKEADFNDIFVPPT